MPTWPQLGPTRANLGSTWANLAQLSPACGQVWAYRANLGPTCFFLIHTVTTPTLASTGMTPILDQPLRARAYRRQAQARESGSGQGYTQPTTHEAPRPPIRGRLGQPIPSPFHQTISSKVRPTSLWPKQVVVSQCWPSPTIWGRG